MKKYTILMLVIVLIRIWTCYQTGMNAGLSLGRYGYYVIPFIVPFYWVFVLAYLVDLKRDLTTKTGLKALYIFNILFIIFDLQFYIRALIKFG